MRLAPSVLPLRARSAISSPLLEDGGIEGARGLLLNITGGADLSLHEVTEAASIIQEEADQDANIIFGAVVNRDISDEVVVTVIATGFDSEPGLSKAVPESVYASQTNDVGTHPLGAGRLASVVKGGVRRNTQGKLPLINGEWKVCEIPAFLRK